MKILVYSAKNYEKHYLQAANQNQHDLDFIEDHLSIDTAIKAKGYTGICCFVTDNLDNTVIKKLAEYNIKLIALRSAGYDHVDIKAAKANNIAVVRVPDYSPQAIAEMAVGLILVLNRKILTAHQQGLEYNFSLENLLGFNLYQKTVGMIGTGKIGTAFAQIMHGFGCHLLAYDPVQNETCKNFGVKYVELKTLLSEADIISLHCLLNEQTRHIIDDAAISTMKKGVMLINTGRGALIDTPALIKGLETGQVGYAGLDVYEYEKGLFFQDHHNEKIQDDLFRKLQSFSNVIITPHQAFFTTEAVSNIMQTTIGNFTAFEAGKPNNQL